MSIKDYKLVADAISSVWGRSAGTEKDTLSEVIEALSYDFVRDNPRFDAKKFVAACTN